MTLLALPAFNDNYIWMLHDGTCALVVDPGQAAPVLAALHEHGLTLSTILVTHHHGDHTGGLVELHGETGATVWGPSDEPMPMVVRQASANVPILWGRFQISVLPVPGHTAGHLAYLVESSGETAILFCGDTLFSGGCGRLFEGTAAQMQCSLDSLVERCGADTRVCCAHEYTLSNLRFALAVEPDNVVLQRYALDCERLRLDGLPTLPSTMAIELAVNPFLRCDAPDVVASALQRGATDDRLSVFTALRTWKNEFK